MKIAHLTLVVFGLLCCNTLLAQSTENEKPATADLYQIEYYQFSTDKAEEARKIIDKYFSIAHQMVGVPHPVMQLQLTSEDYNYMAVWRLPVDIDHLNWQSSPANTDWYNAFVTVAGSEEKAKEIIEKYDSYIRASKTEFARSPY